MPATREQIARTVEVPSPHCGTATEQNVERVFTVNSETRPLIPVDAGERQFWAYRECLA